MVARVQRHLTELRMGRALSPSNNFVILCGNWKQRWMVSIQKCYSPHDGLMVDGDGKTFLDPCRVFIECFSLWQLVGIICCWLIKTLKMCWWENVTIQMWPLWGFILKPCELILFDPLLLWPSLSIQVVICILKLIWLQMLCQVELLPQTDSLALAYANKNCRESSPEHLLQNVYI